MNELKLSIGPKLFEFTSHSQWVNKARSWFATCGVSAHDRVTIDANGRICTCGMHFPTDDDSAYPIAVYAIRDIEIDEDLVTEGMNREIERRCAEKEIREVLKGAGL